MSGSFWDGGKTIGGEQIKERFAPHRNRADTYTTENPFPAQPSLRDSYNEIRRAVRCAVVRVQPFL
jgi:hypothetical protein